MTGPDVVRHAEDLAGAIVQDIYDDFWAKNRYRYGCPAVDYELIGSDETEIHGLPGDDPYLTVLRRKSDGQLFEIEIEVTARAIDAPARVQEIPGQQELTEVTP